MDKIINQYEINQDIVRRWVVALRSGAYIQSSGKLRTKDGFCCLGVLCDIIDPTKWVIHNNDTHPIDYYSYENAITALPDSIAEKVGIERSGRLNGNQYLGEINDSGVHDFNFIADIIECEYFIDPWYKRMYYYLKRIVKKWKL